MHSVMMCVCACVRVCVCVCIVTPVFVCVCTDTPVCACREGRSRNGSSDFIVLLYRQSLCFDIMLYFSGGVCGGWGGTSPAIAVAVPVSQALRVAPRSIRIKELYYNKM